MRGRFLNLTNTYQAQRFAASNVVPGRQQGRQPSWDRGSSLKRSSWITVKMAAEREESESHEGFRAGSTATTESVLRTRSEFSQEASPTVLEPPMSGKDVENHDAAISSTRSGTPSSRQAGPTSLRQVHETDRQFSAVTEDREVAKRNGHTVTEHYSTGTNSPNVPIMSTASVGSNSPNDLAGSSAVIDQLPPPWRPRDSTLQSRAFHPSSDGAFDEDGTERMNRTGPGREYRQRRSNETRYAARTYGIPRFNRAVYGVNKSRRSERYNLRPHPMTTPPDVLRAFDDHQFALPIGGMGNLSLKSLASRPRTTVRAVQAPRPSAAYNEAASYQPHILPKQQPLLVVFDLNGTLLYRPSRKQLTSFVPRPGLDDFLHWLIDEKGEYGHGHRAMIWSSAKPENVNKMADQLFTPTQRKKVVAVWARDKLGLTPQQYANKVQVYKELSKIWTSREIQQSYPGYRYRVTGADGREQWVEETGWWDQSNTVLVDDSILKAASEPYNLLQIPEFLNRPDQANDSALQDAKHYLELIASYNDISCYIRQIPFGRPVVNTKSG